MQTLADLKIKIFADGAEEAGIVSLYNNPLIRGLTTNPTLMKKAGISQYEKFARDILQTVKEKPISFEVFSDDFPEMRRQALKINGWQSNVYVKIPITNTRGELATPLIRDLVKDGVKVNVTAILTIDQVRKVAEVLASDVPSVVSVFAGRIADTGRDPISMMTECSSVLRDVREAELLWASCREVLNILHADLCGARIITVTHDMLKKALNLWGTSLDALSLDTVKMFHEDALTAGFSI